MEPRDYTEEIDVQRYLLALRRRWYIVAGTFLIAVGLTYRSVSQEIPVYEAVGQLLFRVNRTSALTGTGEAIGIGELDALAITATPLDTQAVVVRSIPILQETIDELDLRDKTTGEPISPRDLAGGLAVNAITGTDILRVSYTSEDPELAAAVVNQLMDSYIANNIMSNRAEAASARRFIAEQLPRTEAEVDRAAEALRDFKARNGIIEIQEESTLVAQTIANLDNQIGEARANFVDAAARSRLLRDRVGIESTRAVEVNNLSQAPGVRDALVQLQSVQVELLEQGALYTENHPTIRALRDREASLMALLQERIAQIAGSSDGITFGDLQAGELSNALSQQLVQAEAERLGLQQRVAVLEDLRNEYRRRANALPALSKQEEDLRRKLTVAQTTYENLLSRLQEIRLAENQNVGNARVVQRALLPENSLGTSKKLYMAAAAFAGTMLGIAITFALELMNRSVRNLKELKSLFPYTLVGLIPKFETHQAERWHGDFDALPEGISPRIVTLSPPQSPVQEAYQMLQANLKFMSSDDRVQIVAVTSSVPREGKSEVTANLAAAMVQMGRKVLLVDADMRDPSQHHLWGLLNATGLSHLLVGQCEPAEAVQVVTDRLSVLTAGVVPPNPLTLIDSERMFDLVEYFAETYDYVLFDTPPLAGIADAAVLGKMADGLLLVARPGILNVDSATAAKTILMRSEPNLLGMVANGVNVKNEPDSFVYYNRTRSEAKRAAKAKSRLSLPLLGGKR